MSDEIRYSQYDLGNLKKGSTVQVTLSAAANVRLMDSANLSAYKAMRRHNYYGGLARNSPFNVPVPRDGHWYVTVDLIGLRGSVRSGVRVLPGALPAVRSLSSGSLADIRHDPPPHGVDDAKEWDVFISHASEDKVEVARPLAHALATHGISVWLDETELKIGDSLRRKIDNGLARSRFGVVVLSRHFFAKGWPQYELDGLVSRSVSGQQALLPIWHEITKDEVMAQTPSLVDKIARSTAIYTVVEIAAEIADVVVRSD